jgi:hypothetical protein
MTDFRTDTGHDDAATAVFVQLLDAFGGNRALWPVARRAVADALLQRTDAVGDRARELLREADALDRLIMTEPAVDALRLAALTDRIVLTTQLMPTGSPTASNVVVLDRQRTPVRRHTSTMVAGGRGRWAAAALLAASLLVGVFVGPGLEGIPALREAADVVGLGGYLDQLALSSTDEVGLHDEDVL